MHAHSLEQHHAVFPLLKDAETYQPCHTNLIADDTARAYWLQQFRTLMPMQLDAAASIGVPATARHTASDVFLHELDLFQQQPARAGRLDILLLDTIRQQILYDHGIVNEFQRLKQRENDATMPLLAGWLQRLDELEFTPRIEVLLRGMLAGNLFDMGAEYTAREFAGATVPFESALQRVPDRPWHRDGVDAFVDRWRNRAWGKAVIFADNAGADATLGLLPLARELLRSDIEVVITANDKPTWNDITASELTDLRQAAAEFDSVFASDRLCVIPNGTFTPLADLRQISTALAAAAVDADLVVLIGMGRGIESNWQASFAVDSLRVAMLKDPQTALSVGGTLFDAVVRFDPAE